jgi:LysM repeat protein
MKARLEKLPRHWIGLAILIVSLMPASYVFARTPVPSPTFQSPTETAQPVASTQPSAGAILGYHTVQDGETLYCIARAYGVDPLAIASANGIVNPNLVFPGMVLAIPNVPRSLPSGRTCPSQFAGGAAASAGAASGCRWLHPVLRGQNLFRISLRYGVSVSTIAQANGIGNPNLIYAGQTLCIP